MSKKHQTRPDHFFLEDAEKDTSRQLSSWRKEALHMSQSRPSGFRLDDWQKEAFDALMEGMNVVVDAPTTAGKTKVVEVFFEAHLSDPGFRACYTCPVKSLANDKLKEFRSLYGKGFVGIATGDIKENLEAPIVIATLESYRNSLIGVEPDLGRKIVIFDEYHYIQDDGRGSAWEEAMILTPFGCQILLLSASVSNSDDFAHWLEHISRRQTLLIKVSERPVPLVHMIWQEDKNWYLSNTLPAALLKQHSSDSFQLGFKETARRITSLEKKDLTPALVYAGKRLSCKDLAFELVQNSAPLSKERSREIEEKLKEADEVWQSLSFISDELKSWIIDYGVAYHHSGLAPAARLGIERLIKDGFLRYCVATMGLSLGINFSVRSTVITDFVRPGETGMTPYSSSEVLQMIGRAGRRGMDVVGFACWLSADAFRKLGKASRSVCQSRLKADPSTFLNLLCKGMNETQIENFYKRSFLKFKQPNVNMSLLTQNRIMKKLKTEKLPCESGLNAFYHFSTYQKGLCTDCSFKKNCHKFVQNFLEEASFAKLQYHLHHIGALGDHGNITLYGRMARYFPQNGGLVFAKMIYDEQIKGDKILEACELIAAMSMVRFKDPKIPATYKFPFSIPAIEKMLYSFYPYSLFPENYEVSRYEHFTPRIREFNPKAGWLVREWIEGGNWNDLVEKTTSEFFGLGDITALMYRVASFLQSIIQGQFPFLSEEAKDIRQELLKDPIRVLL